MPGMTNPIRALLIAIAAGAAPFVALQPVTPPTVRAAADVAAPGTGTGGRYLVEFETGSDPYLQAGRLEALGIDVVEVYTNVFDGVAVRFAPNVIDVLRGQPFVTHVEADQVLGFDGVESSVQPTTEQAGAPWGLDRLDQRSLPLSGTYSYNSSGAGVTAYIIDSGISALHTDFGGRVRSGFTTVADGLVTGDCNGHGTHVAGIVGGQASGVAKSVSLVAVRVLDCNGMTNTSQLLDALDWVIADHQAGAPAVANISIGGPPSSLLDAAVQAAITDGVTVVAAAGNETQNACNRSPARLSAALTVAASAENDARASFSNFGSCVDLFAPGVNIPSAGIASTTEIVLKSGTSMSAPHVAGAAAVLLSERPTWTPAQVARDLVASATVGVIADPAGSPNALLFASANAPPGNDQFGSAATLDLSLPTSIAGTNVDASTEPGEPAHGPSIGGTSVWWTFIAPGYGTVTLSTEGSTFDTMLAVYTGSTVSALTAVGSNDGPGNGSNLTIRVEGGRTYHVAVDGGDGSSGTITLAHAWTPSFVSLVPARLLESRVGPGFATADGLFAGVGVRRGGSVTELTVAGRGGVAATASAVVLTVTVTQPVATGFVTVFPCGTPRPLASNVNFAPGATVANSVVSGVGTAGRVCLFTMVDTDLVVDVNGYFPASS
ncbi:MAG: S8 family serine peptidase, partial [Ilumatobacteraceae bacterium]|nr:S8 family serine peptidase [Ilumatobacteraceae bacterium]